MASIVSTLFGNRKPAVRGFASKGSSAQVVLRGTSKRAYSFDVHARDEVGAMSEVPAVYIYARTLSAADTVAPGGNGAGFEVCYVGRTGDMTRQDADHRRLQHFTGHDLDAVLILRIELDLIDSFNPALNDLLRGYNPGDVS